MISNDSQNEKPDSPKQQAKASPRGRRTQRIRRYTQLMAAVLFNCHFTGFAKGRIYQGKLKGVCTPGLNCYSCPGAVAACPLGSLQGALVSSKYRFPYYILGTLLLMGLFLGRFICGFLCPFGLLQELLHKLPAPKIRKSRVTRILSYGKYVILALFVVAIPLWKLAPGFCKYICPAGTFEAGLPLTFKNKALRELTGTLFSWKVMLLTVIVVLCVLCFRAFCRFLCPLGAIYSFFNPVSLFGVRVDQTLCTHCDACVHRCPMDIKKVRDHECIQCGLCIDSCPTGAIHFGVKDKRGTVSLDAAASVAVSAEKTNSTSNTGPTPDIGGLSAENVQARRKIRLAIAIALLAAGIALVAIGLHAGNFRSVMNKAIRICYECIGIG